MKNPLHALLTTTASCELGAGLVLLGVPSFAASLLLGAPFDEPSGLVVVRIAGVALLSLGIVCWLARHDVGGRTVRGLVAAMLVYNLGVVVALLHARLGLGLDGLGLWPAVLLHIALSVWCMNCMVYKVAGPASR